MREQRDQALSPAILSSWQQSPTTQNEMSLRAIGTISIINFQPHFWHFYRIKEIVCIPETQENHSGSETIISSNLRKCCFCCDLVVSVKNVVSITPHNYIVFKALVCTKSTRKQSASSVLIMHCNIVQRQHLCPERMKVLECFCETVLTAHLSVQQQFHHGTTKAGRFEARK